MTHAPCAELGAGVNIATRLSVGWSPCIANCFESGPQTPNCAQAKQLRGLKARLIHLSPLQLSFPSADVMQMIAWRQESGIDGSRSLAGVSSGQPGCAKPSHSPSSARGLIFGHHLMPGCRLQACPCLLVGQQGSCIRWDLLPFRETAMSERAQW